MAMNSVFSDHSGPKNSAGGQRELPAIVISFPHQNLSLNRAPDPRYGRSMLMRRPFLIALFLGGLSACGFAPLNIWPLTLVGLTLWISMLWQSTNGKDALRIGYAFGVGHFTISLNWIAKSFTFQSAMPDWLGYIAVFLLALFLATYIAAAGLLTFHLSGRGKAAANKLTERQTPVLFITALAASWLFAEWLRSWLFTGFAWNPLGVVLVPLGQLPFLAKGIGTYGLSACVILIAGCLWMLAQRRWKLALPVLILFLVPALITKDSLFYTPPPSEAAAPITVIQPNIGQQEKWKAGYEAENLAKLANLTRQDTTNPRLIFWPEASIPDYLEDHYPNRYYGAPPEQVRWHLSELMQPGDILILGAIRLEFDKPKDPATRRPIGARNSAFIMGQDRTLQGRYDKAHLVPFGEYLPARTILSAIGLSRFAAGDLDFWPGEGPASLNLSLPAARPAIGSLAVDPAVDPSGSPSAPPSKDDFTIKMGVQICYEIIFSGQIIDRSNRPDFIFNPSNDAWFGRWGPPQHLAQAQLRAIEEGLPVIRSTPTGISAIITASGLVKDSIAQDSAGRIDAILPPPAPPTFFARHGNRIPILGGLLLLLVILAIRSCHIWVPSLKRT